MSRKYPRISGRITDDVIALRRAVAELTRLLAQTRKYPDKTGDNNNRIWRAAGEVERLAVCIRADAMSVSEAVAPQA